MLMQSKRVVLKSLQHKTPYKIDYGLATSPFGKIVLGFLSHSDNAICCLHFVQGKEKDYAALLEKRWPKALLEENNEMAQQLANDIFSDEKQTIEVVMDGTPFQEAVWEQLVKIPVGSTCTYAEIAVAMGNPKAVRAVGNAVGSNEVAILIPCHRVISKNGDIKYGGGKELKLKLLQSEGVKQVMSQ